MINNCTNINHNNKNNNIMSLFKTKKFYLPINGNIGMQRKMVIILKITIINIWHQTYRAIKSFEER